MSGAIFGGDEVGAVVLDIGSHTFKAGFAGEDSPKYVVPTTVGYDPQQPQQQQQAEDAMDTSEDSTKKRPVYSVGTSRITFPKENRELKNPIEGGLVSDWDIIESMIEQCYADGLQCNSKDHPLMMIEPAWNTWKQRERMSELMFEKFNVPAFFFVKSPVVSSFANGRGTSLVVDSGAEYTTVAPVYDGYVLTQGVRRSKLAGNFVTDQLEKLLQDIEVEVVPPVLISEKTAVEEEHAAQWKRKTGLPPLTDSYLRYMRREVIRDFQMSVCRVSDTPYSEDALGSIPTTHYEFPNGYNRHWGLERYKVTEALFNPKDFSLVEVVDERIEPPKKNLEKPQDVTTTSKSYSSLTPSLFARHAPTNNTPAYATHSIGVQHLISESITACDADVHASLWSNIVLCGGSTLYQGYTERLNNEIHHVAPPGTRHKVLHAPSHQERTFSAWIGGSIYASLGTFQQLWVSSKEFSEHGCKVIEKRCP